MNEKVNAYLNDMEQKILQAELDAKKAEIATEYEEKKNAKLAVLSKAVFATTKKEYAPKEITIRQFALDKGYDKVEKLEDGTRLYYREIPGNVDPDDFSDEDIAAMKAVQEKFDSFLPKQDTQEIAAPTVVQPVVQTTNTSNNSSKDTVYEEITYSLTHHIDDDCLAAKVLKVVAVLTCLAGFILGLIVGQYSSLGFLGFVIVGFFIAVLYWGVAALCEDIHVTRCCLESLKLEVKK